MAHEEDRNGGGGKKLGRPAMDESLLRHWNSDDVFSDGDDEAPVETAKEEEPEGTADGGDDDARQWRRRLKAERRARLRAVVEGIIRELRTPLRDVLRDHVLHRLPVRSLLRFMSVSADWRRHISTPIFRHTQSHAHGSASGVFWQTLPGVPAYSPFDPLAGGVPDPPLSFLPSYPGVAALASCNGLLCCSGVLHSYYVCNPSTAESTPLPEPPLPRVAYRFGESMVDDLCTAVALVFEPSTANLGADYHLVRAYQISNDCKGVYGFQVFSSEAGEWCLSSEVCAGERLIHDSGVSVGGVAYWRTTMQTVVAYDLAGDQCRILPWPMGYETTAQWQLGEIDGRLCCCCVTDAAVEVYALGAGDGWSLLASYMIAEDYGEGIGRSRPVFQSRPWPLRFQSGEAEVLLWLEGRVVGLDVGSERLREVHVAPGEPLMDPWAAYVPYISTFASVFPRGPAL